MIGYDLLSWKPPLYSRTARPYRARKEECARRGLTCVLFPSSFPFTSLHSLSPDSARRLSLPEISRKKQKTSCIAQTPLPARRSSWRTFKTHDYRSAGARPEQHSTAPPPRKLLRAFIPIETPAQKVPPEVSHHYPSIINSRPHPHPCPSWTRRPRSNHHRPRRAAAATSTTPVCTP
jgi:hypothetical protein